MELIKVNNKELEAVLKSCKGRTRKLQRTIEKFMCSDESVAKVDFSKDEYASVWSAAAAMSNACHRSKHRVVSKVLKGEIYLVKLDD